MVCLQRIPMTPDMYLGQEMAPSELLMMIPVFYTSPFTVMSREHFILVVHLGVYNLAEKDLVLDSAYPANIQV